MLTPDPAVRNKEYDHTVDFVLGSAVPGASGDTRFTRTPIRQDMVNAAARLLKAATASDH
ncbi:MAG: hypothetical protein NTW21_25475 [Verrucomicrobia bacterium]|nr:hypothetical protein [Verrucomicrobiota bacterium]